MLHTTYTIANPIPPRKLLYCLLNQTFLRVSVCRNEFIRMLKKARFRLDERLYGPHPPREAVDIATRGDIALGQAQVSKQVIVCSSGS